MEELARLAGLWPRRKVSEVSLLARALNEPQALKCRVALGTSDAIQAARRQSARIH